MLGFCFFVQHSTPETRNLMKLVHKTVVHIADVLKPIVAYPN